MTWAEITIEKGVKSTLPCGLETTCEVYRNAPEQPARFASYSWPKSIRRGHETLD